MSGSLKDASPSEQSRISRTQRLGFRSIEYLESVGKSMRVDMRQAEVLERVRGARIIRVGFRDVCRTSSGVDGRFDLTVQQRERRESIQRQRHRRRRDVTPTLPSTSSADLIQARPST